MQKELIQQDQLVNGGNVNINECYNSGTISGSASAGIAWSISGAITDCYNIGEIIGNGAAGIAEHPQGTITNCYHAGTLTSENMESVGCILYTGSAQLINCYYKNGENQRTFVGGFGEATALEESYMKSEEFLADIKGNESNTAWKRDANINGGMPILSWQQK